MVTMSTTSERQAIAQRVRAIPASGIRRYFDLVSTIPDVISLGVGEPDFATPEQVSAAAVAPLTQADYAATHYSSNYGIMSLREALASHLQARYGVAYDPAQELLITVGVSEALDALLAPSSIPAMK